jgi:uncharacterized protein (TIGR02231 family)
MRLSLSGILILLPSLAFADVELTSRIDSVVVLPDAAIVTRIAPLELQAGASTMVLRGLPSAIDPASIRVEGEGNLAFTIGVIDVRTTPGDANPITDAGLDGKLQQLRDERESIQGRIAAVEGRKGVIELYAQASPEKLSNEAKPLEVAQWSNAWTAIGDGLAQANEELRTLRAHTADLERRISALERARPQPIRPGAPKRDVALSIEATANTTGRLQVSYRVSGASWTSLYDAHLKIGQGGGKPALVLTRRAQVSQRTGEDWENVRLSVSTVRVNRGAAAPDLPPLQVSFVEPKLSEFQDGFGNKTTIPAAPAGSAKNEFGRKEILDDIRSYKPDQQAEQQTAEQQPATAETGAFQASFHVPGRVTVPQDGTAKSLVLNQRSATPDLRVKATPVIDETAYLEASFANEDEAALLPGAVALHRDGAYVGSTRLKLVAPGDTVNLGFGVDDRVKVTRVPLRRKESEGTWLGQTRSDVSEFKTTVKNLHNFPLRITIIDRVPFSENAALKVEALREITPPTERQLQDRRGVMAWSGDYAPGEQKEIRFGYSLRWPNDRELAFEARPLASQ